MIEHRVSERTPRRPHKHTVVALAVATVATLALLAAIGLASGGKTAPAVLHSEIERLAPLDTSQLVVTPGVGQDNAWWKTVVAFMPQIAGLDNLAPTPALGVTHLGYSFSPADPKLGLDQGYVRMLYVETADPDHAGRVARWLSTATGAAAGAFSTARRGNVVVLATSDVPLLAQLAQGREGLGSTPAYQADTAARKPGSLIWEDWGAYVKAAGASVGKPAQYASFFYGATGFTPGSRWVGYATSPQAGWHGKFLSGGVDPTLVSAASVAAAISSFATVLAKDDQGGPLATDPGVGNYLRDSFYVRHPSLPAAAGTMGAPALATSPAAAGDTVFVFDPSMWLAGTSRSASAAPEGSSRFAYSIRGAAITLKVTPSPPSPGPPPDSSPTQVPPGPPAGATPLPVRSAPGPDDVTTASPKSSFGPTAPARPLPLP